MSEDKKEDADKEGDESEDGHVNKKPKKSDQQGDNSSETDDDALDGEHSVMVLTGTNASGKSVYGKAVALIVYMSVTCRAFSSSITACRLTCGVSLKQGPDRLVRVLVRLLQTA